MIFFLHFFSHKVTKLRFNSSFLPNLFFSLPLFPLEVTEHERFSILFCSFFCVEFNDYICVKKKDMSFHQAGGFKHQLGK